MNAVRRASRGSSPSSEPPRLPCDCTGDSNWIETINTEDHELTEWEAEFMESVTRQFGRRGDLSDRQEEVLGAHLC